MSNYGIEIINDYGYNLIDNNFKNMVLKNSGHLYNYQFTQRDRNIYASALLYLSAKQYTAPLIFIRALQDGARCNVSCRTIVVNNEPTFLFEVIKWDHMLFDGYIEYYIFDDCQPNISGQYGINVFDNNGNTCFDGGWKYLNLTDTYLIPPNKPEYEKHNYTASLGSFSQGKKIATCMPLSRILLTREFEESDSIWVFKETIWLDPTKNEVFISCVCYLPVYKVRLTDIPIVESMFLQHEYPALLLIADVGKLPIPYNPLTIL